MNQLLPAAQDLSTLSVLSTKGFSNAFICEQEQTIHRRNPYTHKNRKQEPKRGGEPPALQLQLVAQQSLSSSSSSSSLTSAYALLFFRSKSYLRLTTLALCFLRPSCDKFSDNARPQSGLTVIYTYGRKTTYSLFLKENRCMSSHLSLHSFTCIGGLC